MKMVIISLGIVSFSFFSCAHACQIPDFIEYRKAIMQDAAGIVELINTYGVHDNNKIVILPLKFRLPAVQKNIEAGRYYIARDIAHNKIVAFKKLYLLDDPQELHEVATQELRYAGPDSVLVDSSILTYEADRIEKEKSQVQVNLATRTLLMYTGGDFTAPEYRNKGINTKLTECAFADPDIKKEIGIRLKNSSMIACVYGLTHFNDYAADGSGTSRTIGIARLFGHCIATVMNIHTRIIVYHKRFKSFMPTFDFSSAECAPLPDEQAVPGYGNVLYYQCAHDAQ